MGISALAPILHAAQSPEVTLKPGEVVEFLAPLTEVLQEFATRGGPSAPGTFVETRVAVAVPADFAPDRACPILIVCATADPGYNSSRKLLRQFSEATLAAGWVAVAADPARTVTMRQDTDALRYALMLAALQRLHEAWPALTQSPCAFGGFSGGAKRAALLAALSVLDGRRPLGVFQAGCNEPTMQQVIDLYHPPVGPFRAIPVFLSSGNDDIIAKPTDVDAVQTMLSRARFQHVRLERFDGRHEVHVEHLRQALDWFLEIARAPDDSEAR